MHKFENVDDFQLDFFGICIVLPRALENANASVTCTVETIVAVELIEGIDYNSTCCGFLSLSCIDTLTEGANLGDSRMYRLQVLWEVKLHLEEEQVPVLLFQSGGTVDV